MPVTVPVQKVTSMSLFLRSLIKSLSSSSSSSSLVQLQKVEIPAVSYTKYRRHMQNIGFIYKISASYAKYRLRIQNIGVICTISASYTPYNEEDTQHRTRRVATNRAPTEKSVATKLTVTVSVTVHVRCNKPGINRKEK